MTNFSKFYYYRDDTNLRQWSHPAFNDVLDKVNQLSDIKYAIYRMAYKIKTLQDHLKGLDRFLICNFVSRISLILCDFNTIFSF